MKKFLIISSIIVGLFIVVAFSYSRAKNYNEQPHNDSTQTPVEQLEEEISMIDSKGGVDFGVEEVKRENGKTILKIGINNHVEDYSKVDLKERSELAGVKPTKYTVDESGSGGHHVGGELVFEGYPFGKLTVRLTDDLIFNITIPPDPKVNEILN